MEYFLHKNLGKMEMEKAIEHFTQVAKKHGFGVLTDLNAKEIFKKKLDKDFREYRMLGICNPHLAFRALSSESSVGVFLPCGVSVTVNDAGEVEVFLMDPDAAMQMIDNEEIRKVGAEAKEKLRNIVAEL